MREIKFRAWDKHNKIMHTVMRVNWTDVVGVGLVLHGVQTTTLGPLDTEVGLHFQAYQIELIQYTGLRDKNGVEIYEGDIVARESYQRTKSGEWDKRIPESQRWTQKTTVEWGKWPDYAGGYAVEPGEFCGWCIDPEDLSYIEVIGNIYENPELLK